MTEIEVLEREIKEKQAILRDLKAAKRDGEKLNFKRYRKFRENGFDGIAGADRIIGHLRDFVLMLSTVYSRGVMPNGDRVLGYRDSKVRVGDVSEQNIRICNNLLEELYPVISKYVGIFLETNSRGGT